MSCLRVTPRVVNCLHHNYLKKEKKNFTIKNKLSASMYKFGTFLGCKEQKTIPNSLTRKIHYFTEREMDELVLGLINNLDKQPDKFSDNNINIFQLALPRV